jgi:hypothetical protein
MAERSNRDVVSQIRELLTPESLLVQRDFPMPEIIDPKNYPNFASLRAERVRIRNLQLLPVKRLDDWDYYRSQPPEEVKKSVDEYLRDSDFALRENQFPYHLPADVDQHVLWIKKRDTDHQTIAETIAESMQSMDKTPNEIILFERSQATKTEFVHGSFSYYRHIHVWADGGTQQK